jgi:hypothetical protein
MRLVERGDEEGRREPRALVRLGRAVQRAPHREDADHADQEQDELGVEATDEAEVPIVEVPRPGERQRRDDGGDQRAAHPEQEDIPSGPAPSRDDLDPGREAVAQEDGADDREQAREPGGDAAHLGERRHQQPLADRKHQVDDDHRAQVDACREPEEVQPLSRGAGCERAEEEDQREQEGPERQGPSLPQELPGLDAGERRQHLPVAGHQRRQRGDDRGAEDGVEQEERGCDDQAPRDRVPRWSGVRRDVVQPGAKLVRVEPSMGPRRRHIVVRLGKRLVRDGAHGERMDPLLEAGVLRLVRQPPQRGCEHLTGDFRGTLVTRKEVLEQGDDRALVASSQLGPCIVVVCAGRRHELGIGQLGQRRSVGIRVPARSGQYRPDDRHDDREEHQHGDDTVVDPGVTALERGRGQQQQRCRERRQQNVGPAHRPPSVVPPLSACRRRSTVPAPTVSRRPGRRR